jgi:hypothetical protein
MEALFIYLIKSSALIGMFYVAYYFLLRKETFFTNNRWFLLAGLFTSVILPLLVYTKTVWVNPTPTRFDWSNIPASATAPIQNDTFEINWYLVLAMTYAIGIALFLLKFAFDFFSLTKVLKNKTIQQQADYKFIDVAENVAPFSYFNYIVYNSSLYTQAELENILEHEKVHSAQNHTIDVLISRFFCVVFWYNPFVWLYKKAILQNLEFIADSEASKKIADKKAYQITLLKITTHENCVAITNHFYQSLIKKRIVMLNKNQSNKWNSWKYALVVPVLAAFMLYFQVKVVAQEKNYATKTEVIGTSQVVICKTSTDDYIKESCDRIKKMHNIDLKFFKIKRNSQNEITSISAKFNDNNGSEGTHNINSDEPIKPFEFSVKKLKNGKRDVSFRNADDEDTKENEDFVSEIQAPEAPEAPEALEALDALDALDAPEAPEAPTHPYENLIEAPTPPDFPNIPELPSNLNNKKAMAKYEKATELYDQKMKIIQPKMEAFNKEMEQYNKKMESLEPEMKKYDKEMVAFNKKMEEFNKEMELFGEKMGDYQDKITAQNIKIEKKNIKLIKKRRKQ